ncbi:MAG: MCP four helix bundle domain-containing protein [Rikenellaceae bacterium]
MTGLRRRVSVGFLSIVILLSISGVIAFFELNTLSRDTKSILNVNNRKMELAHQMLSIVQDQDVAFVQMTIFNDKEAEQQCLINIKELEATLETAASETSDPRLLDSLSFHLSQLELLTHTVINQPEFDTLSVVNRASYYDNYQPIHTEIISSIYDFTTSSFKSIEPRAEQLQRNAYRAVTPVFISLVVMIVIVLMLYYFMIIYCVNPIVRLNRSLGDFLTYRLPFTSKDDCNDEVKELQDKIEQVTTYIRRESSNNK